MADQKLKIDRLSSGFIIGNHPTQYDLGGFWVSHKAAPHKYLSDKGTWHGSMNTGGTYFPTREEANRAIEIAEKLSA